MSQGSQSILFSEYPKTFPIEMHFNLRFFRGGGQGVEARGRGLVKLLPYWNWLVQSLIRQPLCTDLSNNCQSV